jgi:hypothetical protein
VLFASIIRVMKFLIMESPGTSEMSVDFYQATWPNNLEDSHLHTHLRENLREVTVVTTLKLGKGPRLLSW